MDRVALRIVVGGLAAALLAAIVAEAALAALRVDAPGGIGQVGSCCVGALSAILSHVLTASGARGGRWDGERQPPAGDSPHEELSRK